MVSRAQYVGYVVVNSLKSGIRYLPFFIVLCLSNVSHVHSHNDIRCLPVLFDPFSLLEKAGPLIADVRPVLLRLPMPCIGVALRVRQDDQSEEICIRRDLRVAHLGKDDPGDD